MAHAFFHPRSRTRRGRIEGDDRVTGQPDRPPERSAAVPQLFIDASVGERVRAVLAQGAATVSSPATADLAVIGEDAADVGRIRLVCPSLPLLAVVATRPEAGGSQRAAALLNAGADACVVCPTPTELEAHVAALLRRRPARP